MFADDLLNPWRPTVEEHTIVHRSLLQSIVLLDADALISLLKCQ